MTTFIEELNDALHAIKAVDHEEPLIDENGKRWGSQHYTLVDEESIEAAAQNILNLVSERIIGEDLPLITEPNTGQRIHNKMKAEQRTTLYEGQGEV